MGEARRPHWYVEGQVPDTLDGRFAVLATLVALATVRLERGDETARLEAVALAERFVEAMDAEHRELGIGDPALGKTVRKLVGALARRVELWRPAIDRDQWDGAVTASLFRGAPTADALVHCEAALRGVWAGLEAASDEALAEGRIG
ncbi:MAG: ubiquinol-cytochrome C chaperone family protein [Sphingomicrobium sp.]